MMATRRGLLDLPCITSTKNPRVKAARTAAKRGLVKLEGVRLVLDAVSHGGVVPELVFIADDLFKAFSSASSASVSSSASFSSPDPSGLLHDALSPLLPRLGPDRIVRAAPHVIAAVSDTASPQGIVAFARRPDPAAAAAAAALALSRTRATAASMSIVCDGVSDPGNLGTLIRSAAAAEADVVCCVTPCCDPWSNKVLRAGMGAHFRLPVVHGTRDHVVRALLGLGLGDDTDAVTAEALEAAPPAQPPRVYVAGGGEGCGGGGSSSSSGSGGGGIGSGGGVGDGGGGDEPAHLGVGGSVDVAYTEVDWTEPFVLVLGNEADGPLHSWASGLVADDAGDAGDGGVQEDGGPMNGDAGSGCGFGSTNVVIPMGRGVESLNVGVAASIILFEARRQRGL